MLKTSFLIKALRLKQDLLLQTALSGNWRIFLQRLGCAGMKAVCWTKGPSDFVPFGHWRKILQKPERAELILMISDKTIKNYNK